MSIKNYRHVQSVQILEKNRQPTHNQRHTNLNNQGSNFCLVCVSRSVICNSTVCDPTDCSRPAPPGKNTGVDCHSLLQRIFPIQVQNPGLPHCRQILYRLSYREVLQEFLPYKLANMFCRENTNNVKSESFDQCCENVKWDTL